MQCGKVLVPISRHFPKDIFTIAVLDNFDHQDRSSLTGVKAGRSTSYQVLTQATFMTLLQRKILNIS